MASAGQNNGDRWKEGGTYWFHICGHNSSLMLLVVMCFLGGGNMSSVTKDAVVCFPAGQQRNRSNLLSHRYGPLEIKA
jgi:hypothetical protein